mgnify:CR=1 FL=1
METQGLAFLGAGLAAGLGMIGPGIGIGILGAGGIAVLEADGAVYRQDLVQGVVQRVGHADAHVSANSACAIDDVESE